MQTLPCTTANTADKATDHATRPAQDRSRFRLEAHGQPALALQVQRPTDLPPQNP